MVLIKKNLKPVIFRFFSLAIVAENCTESEGGGWNFRRVGGKTSAEMKHEWVKT